MRLQPCTYTLKRNISVSNNAVVGVAANNTSKE